MDYLNRITSLNRLLDPRYPTNLAIILVAMTAGAAVLFVELISSEDFLPSLIDAVYAGFAVFFAWALSRELDPDHELSAFISALLAFVVFFYLGRSNLLSLLFMLILLRMLVRTVGPPLTLLDSLLILAIGSWLTFEVSWVYGFVAAAGYFLDGFLPNPLRRHYYFAIVLLFAALLSLYVTGFGHIGSEFMKIQTIFVMLTILLFIPFVFSYRTIASTSDRGGLTLSPVRLKSAHVLALFSVLGIWIFEGISANGQLMPLWAALFGVSVFFVSQSLYNRLNRN